MAAVEEQDDAIVKCRLSLSLNVVNPSGRELRDQALSLRLPALRSPTQRLVHVEVPMAHELRYHALQHTVLELRWPSVAPYFNGMVSVRSWVELWRIPLTEPLAEPGRWLCAERFIEADEAAVRALANRLARDSETASAHAIFEWVSTELQYAGYLAETLGAASALRERRGDCTEYACLSAALARAIGIPARVLGGYVVEGDSAPAPGDYHDWAEFYLDGAWRLVDAQKRFWWTAPLRYVRFTVFPFASEDGPGGFRRFKTHGPIEAVLSAGQASAAPQPQVGSTVPIPIMRSAVMLGAKK